MEFASLRLPECPSLCVAIESASDGLFRPKGIGIYAEAVVYLGAVCDAEGNPREIVEIWVQEVEGIQRRFDTVTGGLSNETLDARWRRMVDGFRVSDGSGLLRGPWERAHSRPCFLCEESGEVVYPDGDWKLCEDDALLEKKGLYPYSTTLHRYLYTEADAPRLRFVPLTADPDADDGDATTVPFEVAFPGLRPINREGGLMMVRSASALRFEDFVDVLGGREFEGGYRKLVRVPVSAEYEVLRDPNVLGPPGIGFIHGRARGGKRPLETVFLKLCALRGAMQAVRAAVREQNVPFLNLSADSFGVGLVESSAGLPFLWNHRVTLRAASSAVRVSLGIADEDVFILCGDRPAASAYAARGKTEPQPGTGQVTFGQPMKPDDRGLSIVEGTLVTETEIDPSWQDLLELDVKLRRPERLRLYAKILPQHPNSSGHRFQTLDMKLPAEFVEGKELAAPTSFRVIPRLGSTRDLYSLGVLALRVLMVRDERPLPEVHRDLMGLLRDYNKLFDENDWDTGSRTLADFMLAGRGDVWRVRLGPSLSTYGLSHEAAAESVPERLWWQIIEFVARLFPGEVPESFCGDFNDFELRAPALVFDEPLSVLDGLIEQCRGVLFGDPVADSEIAAIIATLAEQNRGGD